MFKLFKRGARARFVPLLAVRLLMASVVATIASSCLFAAALCPILGCRSAVPSAKPVVSTSPFIGAQLAPGPIVFPPGFMTSVMTYGAKGDGITDDTNAIQKALNDGRSNPSADYYGLPKALYFPPGTYLVSHTLQWNGCCVALQGAGPSVSVIKLAAGSEGFADAGNPKPLILTPQGNESFRQNIWDIGITVGANNAGATAVNYVSNNMGSIHNVQIVSEDGTGHAGIDLTRKYAGPLLLKNVQIEGFDTGIDLNNAEYSVTLEGITLRHQNIAGIRNALQSISIEGLNSVNSVPAITNSGGFVVLLNAVLAGGSPSADAIGTDSTVYLRQVFSTGYKATLYDGSSPSPHEVTGGILEYLAGTAQGPGNTSAMSLKLKVESTPAYQDENLNDWMAFIPKWYGDTSGLQQVLDSGKSTVYFPFSRYFSWSQVRVTVPDSVNRVIGFSSVINGSSDGPNGGGIVFVVDSNDPTPLVLEQFGYGLQVEHHGTRPVVIKDAANIVYTGTPGTGDLFFEDVVSAAFVVHPGQHVWARQLNTENPQTNITNQGGILWILGLKTERAATVIDTTAGGETELLGALIYPATPVPSTNVAFSSVDSSVSYMYKESVYCGACGYAIQIQDTAGGQSRTITSNNWLGFRMPLFTAPNP